MKAKSRILYFAFAAFAILLVSCRHGTDEKPQVRIETSMGDIVVELYPKQAPKTVHAFIENVKHGIYKESSFYRVLKSDPLPTDFNTGIIQGGIWNKEISGDYKPVMIPHEPTTLTGLSNKDGAISMARKDTGTASTEFFICIGDQSSLDAGRSGTPDGQGYAAFGRVLQGMKTVRAIQNRPSKGDHFVKPIDIINIRMY